MICVGWSVFGVPLTPLHAHTHTLQLPLSPFCFLSVLKAQRKLSPASPPFFFFLFQEKHPKNLISIQHASAAHCIESRALSIQSACLYIQCVRACVRVREGDTMGESLHVNPQGHVQTLAARQAFALIFKKYFNVNDGESIRDAHLNDQMHVGLLILK